ncbi:CDK5RAP3-like protein [Pseudolycoriella hygida]|uniref:CDK5RAP3-like protein n=1 Tax=Pseudolycoriella hygida TaxID=35572 RepID=A0A9Q0MIS7_9DIPT|nr:CDK5RAP3-like protein [Pseudolycoriella hygida]
MNEQDIPIEISATKLLEWLESRKIVSKNWQAQVREIRSKISNALNDMPVHPELVKLLSGSYINYFHCLQIVEILKTTEADTKSLFGRYGSQRMNDWQSIVRAYEKDSVYLAEAGQILQRQNVEVPGLRKQRNKIGQMIDDTEDRIKDLIRSEEHLLKERQIICQQLGIKGSNLKEEFIGRIKKLPKFYDEIVKALPKLRKAIDYYLEFSSNSEFLPLVRHILEYGNTTVYQFIYNEPPLSVEVPPITVELTDNEVVADGDQGGIDFGDLEPQIDFGEGEVQIDFGDDIVVQDDDGIDWGDVSDVAVVGDISLEESGIVVAGSGLDGGVARGNEAFTVLDNPLHRDQFLDEIFELQAFLMMRLYELKSDQSNSFVFSLIEVNSKYDVNSVDDMHTCVQNILNLTSNEALDHLHRLKHSPKYAKILAGKLQQQLVTVDKTRSIREILKEKIVTLSSEKENIRPVIARLIANTKHLQQQIENDISKRYKGRNVILYGGVDTDPLD